MKFEVFIYVFYFEFDSSDETRSVFCVVWQWIFQMKFEGFMRWFCIRFSR